MSIIDTIKYESNFKLVIAGLVVLGVVFMIFYNPYDEDYMQEVEKEIIVAKKLCENSREYILRNVNRLKLSDNVLDNIKVDGKLVKFEHLKHPQVLFFHTGYGHKNAGNELFCNFSDPRDKSKDYFYDYDIGSWVNRMRTRR